MQSQRNRRTLAHVLVDARGIAEGEGVETDVCVVGAGAAGIAFARELSGRSLRVAVLESGGLEPDPRFQALSRGRAEGDVVVALEGHRLRQLGGSSQHWAGRVRPLEPEDFAEREWVPESGWPIGREHLMPYYERAAAACQVPWTASDWETSALQARIGAEALPLDESVVVSRAYAMSPPTRFGTVYRGIIGERSCNLGTSDKYPVRQLPTA